MVPWPPRVCRLTQGHRTPAIGKHKAGLLCASSPRAVLLLGTHGEAQCWKGAVERSCPVNRGNRRVQGNQPKGGGVNRQPTGKGTLSRKSLWGILCFYSLDDTTTPLQMSKATKLAIPLLSKLFAETTTHLRVSSAFSCSSLFLKHLGQTTNGPKAMSWEWYLTEESLNTGALNNAPWNKEPQLFPSFEYVTADKDERPTTFPGNLLLLG